MTSVFLVHGPPGTGKTTYLSRQARRAVDEHGPENVAIASLTRAAAAEIAGRDTGIPEGNVGTLHAACFRALGFPRLAETPEGLKAWNADHPTLRLTGGRTTLEDAPLEAEGGSGATRADELHSAVMNHRARRTPRENWTEDERDYDALWTDWKTETNRCDFTDLIERALVDLDRHPASPEVLLLDEAQDFSALELALSQRWAAGAGTTVICGDTDQALYAWRGSDPDALLAMATSGSRVLEQSYRVPRAVHELAAGWVQQIAGRADISYLPTDQEGEARRLSISLRNVEPLLEEIQADLDGGRTVQVLTACGYMLAPVIALLRKHGIPFHNPHRVTAGAWNPMRAASRLLAFLRPDERVWGEQSRLWTWDDLRRWTDPLQARSALARGAKAFIASKCEEDRFGESQADREVPLEQLVDLLGVSPSAWTEHPAIRLDVDWWASHLRASEAAKARFPLEVLRQHGHAALTADRRVVVGTIHSVKGSEADSVYVFPDLSRQGMWQGWQPGGPTRDQIVRMIYVALTRARQRVTVLDPAGPEHVPLELLGAGDAARDRGRAALAPSRGKAAA